ncbi:hypothetical protein [Pseudoalteromonas rubra]|uniref:Uncharacterized protein n=1 Tax=Pseudoalteromonas rubra TaxID=43658 RepID=A0A5S3WX18_9GAMM|nr:hypothetical protein [Pseudoalteromonas rubra]TMP35701.1 hypothetical protein CWB98_15675 [Pseudoalteromonas rubra]
MKLGWMVKLALSNLWGHFLVEGSRLGVHASRSLRCEAVLRSQFTHVKVGHCQAPNKRKPDSKESGFFAFGFKNILDENADISPFKPIYTSALDAGDHTAHTTSTLKQTYSALKIWFKWIPHRVRGHDGVAVGGVVKQGKPVVTAGWPHRWHDKYTRANLLNTENWFKQRPNCVGDGD